MGTDQQFLHYIKESEHEFSGWDFSYISATGRVSSSLLTWSYGSMAKALIPQSHSMLDMGTGGGELLSMLRPYPASVYATEGYKPNFPIAKEKLDPLGVSVVQVEDDDSLPFSEGQFDLIINKHESYSPKEIRRIIAENGIFLTQQVGGSDCNRINEALGIPANNEYSHWSLEYAVNELEANGFAAIVSKEEFPVQRFYDVGALVYYLKAIPWQVPDFHVKEHKEALYDIHQFIQTKGYFDVEQHRFIIKAAAK